MTASFIIGIFWFYTLSCFFAVNFWIILIRFIFIIPTKEMKDSPYNKTYNYNSANSFSFGAHKDLFKILL